MNYAGMYKCEEKIKLFSKSCICKFFNKDNIQSFMGEWLCSIDDENIFKDFMNLEKYLIESKTVYSDEFSSQYVSNIILELSAQHSKGEM